MNVFGKNDSDDMDYELELEHIFEKIIKSRAAIVCIQLPSGLKGRASFIQQKIEERTGCKVVVWAGSCFGACDVPNLDGAGVDLLVQWGHADLEGPVR
ncbi:MAG: diphthamide synthesis protein [Candidatus Woesearchaeota archaeon]|nr:diphthamide synthesis protein [Candidatus Woesearchaeota archaeon]